MQETKRGCFSDIGNDSEVFIVDIESRFDIERPENLSFDGLQEGIPEFIRIQESREFAPSMEVQAEEIREVFFDYPELQYDVWKDLSVQERVNALSTLEAEVANIEMRNPISVEHESTAPGLMGYFDPNKLRLVISDNLLTSDRKEDYVETLNTLFHEGRHAYQNYNLTVARTEASDEMVEAWRVNYMELGYASSSIEGFWRYYAQPVEVDARLFAETVVRKLDL